MAARLLDDEPELAFQHALAASRRGGRMAPVREAVGLTAYSAGHYGEALREFRTFRRISGSNVHLPVMVDCERGLGRPERALEMAKSEDAAELDAAGKVELAIVVSGARADLGQNEAAVSALEIPQLDRNRAFSFSPRLFRAYADALQAVGRGAEADDWRRQARVAENALGVGDFAEPEIIDLGEDEVPEKPPRPSRHADRALPANTEQPGEEQPDEGQPAEMEATAEEADLSESGEAAAAESGLVAGEPTAESAGSNEVQEEPSKGTPASDD
ncbi:hypothetical protein [Crystallibacter crystallopoietes]|nr:hypothetical protein [Arthrobacter crystallopoietes]